MPRTLNRQFPCIADRDVFLKAAVPAAVGVPLISLLFIWLYQGRQGPHPKWFRWFCYAFYPVHLAVLTLVLRVLIR